MESVQDACGAQIQQSVKKRPGVCTLAAQAASVVLHPFFMPLYAALVLLYGDTLLAIFPFRVKIFIIVDIVLCTILLPGVVISLFKKLRLISSLSLDERRERWAPMLAVAACYGLCIHVLSIDVALQLVNRMLVGGLIALGVGFAVTFFWKISMHMTAIGGVAGLLFAVSRLGFGSLTCMLCVAVLCAGVLGSARLCLGKHNIWQVAAGFAVGFAVMLAVMRF